MNVIDLPDGWPSLFPLPTGAHAVLDESDPEALRVSFHAPDGFDLRTFFARELPRNGWEVSEEDDAWDGEIAVEFEGHGYFGQIELEITSPAFCVQLVP